MSVKALYPGTFDPPTNGHVDLIHRGSKRSEERRVGKECRSRCDWSSDVCSSDLLKSLWSKPDERQSTLSRHLRPADQRPCRPHPPRIEEIGRASCRERV